MAQPRQANEREVSHTAEEVTLLDGSSVLVLTATDARGNEIVSVLDLQEALAYKDQISGAVDHLSRNIAKRQAVAHPN